MSACAACLRRTWLLGELSGVLDRHAPRPDRLDDILALEDVALIEAVAGSRRAEVGAAYETFAPAADGGPSTCVHAAGSSAALTRTGTIALSCDASRLEELLGPPAVLICGTRAPSDYGAQVAHDLARGAAAAGVTVAVVALPGIASAALRGALAGGGMPMLAARGGIAASAGLQRGVAAAVRRSGCVLALLPATRPPARWGVYAAMRLLAEICGATVLVESEANVRELFGPRVARAGARAIAAVPGRSGSPLAAGPHALIRGGATLIRGADDLLDLLHVASLAGRAEPPSTSLPEHLQAVLCAVGSGRDTHGRLLAGAHGEAIDLLGALGELELLGLLARGEGGRYLVRHSIIR